MSWHEAIGEDLPPRRPDEPAALRDDITSELADHLTCAMRRELRRTDDERAARANVLEKFGDPARVARRLWLDAMKEMIMRDRILLAGIAVMALVSIGAVALAWRALDQGREVNQAILTQLSHLGSSESETHPADWSELTVRLVSSDAPERPASGIDLRLERTMVQISEEHRLVETTDDEGYAHFGLLPFDRYNYQFATRSGLQCRGLLNLRLGGASEETLIYPAVERDARVHVGINWPKVMKDRRCILVAWFDMAPMVRQFGESICTWRTIRLVSTPDEMTVVGWNVLPPSEHQTPLHRSLRRPLYVIEGYMMRHMYRGLNFEPDEGTMVFKGQYHLNELILFVPTESGSFQDCWSHVFSRDDRPIFEARSGLTNRWLIELPEEVREGLRVMYANIQAQDSTE